MAKTKEEFIAEYEMQKGLSESDYSKKGKRFLSKFTLRNVLAFFFLFIGIITLVIYFMTATAYENYGEQYKQLAQMLHTLGLNGNQQNAILLQLVPVGRMDWVKIYKELTPYIIGTSAISFILSIVLWALCPNFKFFSLFRKRKG